MATAVLEANFHSEKLNGDLTNVVTNFKLEANERMGSIESSVKGVWKEAGEIKEAQTKFEQTVTREYAQITSLATYKLKDDSYNIYTLGEMNTYVNNKIAQNSIIASFTKNNVNGIDVNSNSSLWNYATEHVAGFDLLASFDKAGVTSYASIKSMVDEKIAAINIRAEVEDSLSFIYVGSDYIEIYNRKYINNWGAGSQTSIYLDDEIIELNSREVYIASAEYFTINAAYSKFNYEVTFRDKVTFRDNVYMSRLYFGDREWEVGWKELWIDGDKATVLGWTGNTAR